MMKKILERFKGKRILVIGDICLDRYRIGDTIYGSAREGNNISIIRYIKGKEGHKDEYSPGAGGNIAWNLASLGAKVSVLGIIGKDYNGEILKKELERRSIKSQFLFTSGDRMTITFEKSYDVKDPSKPIQRWDTENNFSLSQENELKFKQIIYDKHKDFDAIVAADYCEVDETTAIITDNILSVLENLHKKVRTFGVSRNRMGKFRNFYCLIPNDNELVRATEKYETKSFNERISKEIVISAGKLFYQQSRPDNLIVTMGEEGAVLFDGKKPKHILTTPFETDIDITGCGDTFLATLTLADLAGLNMRESIKIANISAGLTAKKLGTTGVSTIDELLEGLKK